MKISPNQSAFRIPQNQKPGDEKQQAVKKSESAANKPIDQYIPTEKVQNAGYEKPVFKADTTTIERLKAESEKAFEQLRNLVRDLLERQGISMEDAVSGEKEVITDEQTRTEAQNAIRPGGAHSPEMVSDRLVEFANAVSGGDRSKFELLKNAIEEGFSEAKKALGGELPEISQKTYELAMEKLNKWKDEV
ncbi:hypothetical protein [Sporosarcina cascadiensis]|uniref:hypothetical protein n=1 Tax=Sporosarcina cascadiensis TaxID=2660747 RepID=UPI00129A72DB|nr:hypothetical protein [Sporosarcina cascadiensis]